MPPMDMVASLGFAVAELAELRGFNQEAGSRQPTTDSPAVSLSAAWVNCFSCPPRYYHSTSLILETFPLCCESTNPKTDRLCWPAEPLHSVPQARDAHSRSSILYSLRLRRSESSVSKNRLQERKLTAYSFRLSALQNRSLSCPAEYFRFNKCRHCFQLLRNGDGLSRSEWTEDS